MTIHSHQTIHWQISHNHMRRSKREERLIRIFVHDLSPLLLMMSIYIINTHLGYRHKVKSISTVHSVEYNTLEFSRNTRLMLTTKRVNYVCAEINHLNVNGVNCKVVHCITKEILGKMG